MDETPQSSRFSPWIFGVAAIFLISVVVIVWGLVGDLSEPRGYLQILPVKLPAAVERALLIAAIPASLASLIALAVAFAAEVVDRRWIGVIATLLVAAVAIGFGGRVLAAETHGANIGGGLLIMFGGPLLLLVLGFAAAMSVKIRRSR